MKKVYRFFRSMRFGIIVLVLVMVCSLAGSLIAQRQAAMRYVEAYGSRTASLLIGLGLDDVFHTWYFYALLGLLCLNLTLCSLARFPVTLQAAKRLRERAATAEAVHPLRPGEAERLRERLKARRFALKDGVYCKHAAGFYGAFLTHLSILVILVFGALALMTPEIQDLTVMPGGTLTLGDGTRITCESFHISDETGRLDYASLLAVTDGRSEKRQEIRVNQPLRFGSYKIYQQTYGTAGRVRIYNRANGAEDTVFLTEPCFLSIDGQNGIWFNALYPAFIRDEDGNYTLITSTSGSYQDPVYSVQSITGGMSASVLAFPDEEISIGDITFTFLSPAEYPGLRIKRVSTALYAGLYFGFGLMVAALYLCFFAVPVCLRVEEDGFALCSPKEQTELLDDIEAERTGKET